MVIDYLNARTQAAWAKGKDGEAQDCARFMDALEEMTDAEFDGAYNTPPESVGVIS